MAKLTLGPIAGSISGSIGGTTYSRNRYGVYIRRRAIPVQPETPSQLQARQRMAHISSAWKSLTAAQRSAWKTWAATNPVFDSLGQAQTLQGNSAYIMLNNRLLTASQPVITDPPVIPPPDALETLEINITPTPLTVNLVFTPSPLDDNSLLWVRGTVTDTSTKVFVKNLLKIVKISSTEQASPLNITTELQQLFGTISSGQKIHIRASILDIRSGMLSVANVAEAVVSL